MSYSSKAYFAHQERLLEPDQTILTGRRIWHQPVIEIHNVAVKAQVELSEKEITKREDEFLKSKGIL